jgi:excisionase family DNA binding protein
MSQPERIMLPEAAEITGLPDRTIQALSQRGEIWGAAKLGRRWTFDRLRLRAWIAAKENVTPNPIVSTRETAFGMPASLLMGESADSLLKQMIERKRKDALRRG